MVRFLIMNLSQFAEASVPTKISLTKYYILWYNFRFMNVDNMSVQRHLKTTTSHVPKWHLSFNLNNLKD